MPSPQVSLAPMEGVVDFVIRDIFSKIGGYDFLVTEFIRVTHQLLPTHVFERYCPELKNQGLSSNGTPVYVQLLGSDPELMAAHALRAIELGASGVDINFGCPAKTVNRHDGGATLLKNPHRLFDVTSALRKHLPPHIPVTTKVRLGFDHKNYVTEISQAVYEAGAHHLTVHARTKVEGYKPPAHWEYIAQMKEATPLLPLIANGDIWSVEDYFKCREISGCDNVAIGRPAMASPGLAQQIKAAYRLQQTSGLVWQKVKSELLPEFMQSSAHFRTTDYAVSRTKQWSKLLGRKYPQSQQLFESIKRYRTYEEIWCFLNKTTLEETTSIAQ